LIQQFLVKQIVRNWVRRFFLCALGILMRNG
jgi:hypothetical protein